MNFALVFFLGFCFLKDSTQSESKATIEHSLVDTQRLEILRLHNEYRRNATPTASNMIRLTWDRDLEKMARDYSRTCPVASLMKSNQGKYWMGENMYISANLYLNGSYLTNIVHKWHAEISNFAWSSKHCPNDNKPCFHYMQVVWAISQKLGCGMTTCDRVEIEGVERLNPTIVVCNYMPGGNYDYAPYEKGVPCSNCLSGYECKEGMCANPNSTLLSKGSSAVRSVALRIEVFLVAFVQATFTL